MKGNEVVGFVVFSQRERNIESEKKKERDGVRERERATKVAKVSLCVLCINLKKNRQSPKYSRCTDILIFIVE